MAEPTTLTAEQLRHMWSIRVTHEQVTGEGTPLYKQWKEFTRRYELTKPFTSREAKLALSVLNAALAIEIENPQPRGLDPQLFDLPEPNNPSQKPPWHDQPMTTEGGTTITPVSDEDDPNRGTSGPMTAA